MKRMSSKIGLLLLCGLAMALGCAHLPAQAAQTSTASAGSHPAKTILLWPDGAPGAKGDTAVDKPSITVYLPSRNPTHTGILLFPGGGYTELAIEKEGTKPAEWLNARGVAAFVLTYRLGPRYHYPVELLDAQRAIRYVRSHAAQYGLDPSHIGVWGFSAGGHLATLTGTHFDSGNPNEPDPIDRAGSRPDFMVLAYPVISMEPGIVNIGSMHNLLGDEPDPILRSELSSEAQVTSRTSPAFLYATTDDPGVKVMNSVLFYEALVHAGVPAELHLFEQGPHGSGLGQGNPQLSMWPVLLQNWLHLHGWMASGADCPAVR